MNRIIQFVPLTCGILTMLLFKQKGAGGDIPVKEIMDLMQADPAFDVLFSFFGLGKCDFPYFLFHP